MEPFAFANKTQEYDEAQTLNVKTLGAGATVYWNLQTQQNAEITLTQSVTFAAPLGWKKGRLAMLEVIQGGSGSYTIAWNTAFKNMTLTLATAVGSSNILVFKCIDNGGVCLLSNNASTRA